MKFYILFSLVLSFNIFANDPEILSTPQSAEQFKTHLSGQAKSTDELTGKILEAGVPISLETHKLLNKAELTTNEKSRLRQQLDTITDQVKTLSLIKNNRYNFKTIPPEVARAIRQQYREHIELGKFKQGTTLEKMTYTALFNQLNSLGEFDDFNKSCSIPALVSGEDVEDANKNSLENLANSTINSSVSISLSSLLAGRTDIENLPKELGKLLGNIKKGKIGNGQPGRLNISVDTRMLGDYKGDLTSFLKLLSEAGVTLWLHVDAGSKPNPKFDPPMSLYELAEVSRYVGDKLKRGTKTKFGDPLGHGQVQITTNWKALKDVKEFQEDPKVNKPESKDGVTDRYSRLSKGGIEIEMQETIPEGEKWIKEYKTIYDRSTYLAENGASLRINFPPKEEQGFSDKDYSRLYLLHSAIALSGKEYSLSQNGGSNTHLSFPSAKSIQERFRNNDPKWDKSHEDKRFFQKFLDCASVVANGVSVKDSKYSFCRYLIHKGILQ
jgi:hypothetical protein